VFVPELRDPLVQLAELGCENGVMSTGQAVQENGAVLARALDLATDFSQISHIWENDRGRWVIPSAIAQIADLLFVQTEEVTDLVEDGDADLAAELLRVGKRVHQR
jgi:hypothetical protein